MKNRIKNHKEKLDKIDKIEKLQRKGEELNKDQKEQLKKKEDILLRLSECEIINDTLNAKVGKDSAVKIDKKPSAENIPEPNIKVEKIIEKVEVLKEVTNTDLAVLCCQLRLVNWEKGQTVKAELSK